MYEVDELDSVIELTNIPQSSVGAPIPIVLAGEYDVFLAYYLENISESWDGASVRMVSADTEGEPVAIVKFVDCYSHMFGAPNDEAFQGHPLSERGLKSYGVFEVQNSSWIRKLEKMNSIHPCHDKKSFMEDKKHYVFSFHDTTFECIAKDFEVDVTSGSVKSVIPGLLEKLSD